MSSDEPGVSSRRTNNPDGGATEPMDGASRRLKRLAVAVWLGSMSAIGAAAWLWAAADFEPPAVSFYRGPLVAVAEWAMVVIAASTGVIIARRRPRQPLGWIIAASGAVVALQCLAVGLQAFAEAQGLGTPGWLIASEWLASTLTIPVGLPLFVLVTVLFPDGRLYRRRSATLVWGSVAAAVIGAVGLGFAPGPLAWYPTTENPLGAPAALAAIFTAAWWIGVVGLLASLLGAAALFIMRYRGSGQIERFQMRWFGYAVCVTVAVVTLFFLVWASGDAASSLSEAITAAMILAASLPWLATAIAIHRYHLFEIDTIINRTLVYGLLLAFLAGAYAASIRLFTAIFTSVTGDTSDIALVLTTLVLATTFTPVKSALEGLLGRWAADARTKGLGSQVGADGPASTVDVGDPALRALIAEIVDERLERRRS